MGKKKATSQEQPTIWEVPDDVWPLIQTILDAHYPAKPKGHRRVNLSRVVEADGGPLGAAIAGANVHDTKLLAATLESIVVERPQPTAATPQHLCLG